MRNSEIARRTRETDIMLRLELDGGGKGSIESGVGFLDHMLTLFAAHGRFDLALRCTGDTQVDDHHSVEDIGICLGMAFAEALGDRRGIRRYGFMILPMDESLCQVALDLGGRPFMVYNVNNERKAIKTFDVRLVEEFFRALMTQARMNLHINHLYGDEVHHAYESVFKAFARALRMAVEIDPREGGVPSSKGVI